MHSNIKSAYSIYHRDLVKAILCGVINYLYIVKQRDVLGMIVREMREFLSSHVHAETAH